MSAMPTQISLEIIQTKRDEITAAGRLAARLQVTATAGAGEDSAIFAYQPEAYDRTQGSRGWVFSHVCSPNDMWDYPIIDPSVTTPEDLQDFGRASAIDVMVPSFSTLDDLVSTLQADVLLLLQALQTASDGDTETTTVVITP